MSLSSQTQPINDSFEADLDAAREKAEAYEAGQNEKHASTQPEEDGNAQPAEREEPSSSEPDEGQELSDDPDQQVRGQREASQPRRAQREQVDPEKLEEIKALAEEVGLEVDDRGVHHSERAKWRQKMREDRNALREDYDRQVAELEQRAASLADKFSQAEQLASAIEDSDHDKIAELMGHKSWMELNRSFAHKAQSPQYKEMQALKKKIAEQEAQAEARQKRLQEEQRAQAESAKRTEYAEDVRSYLADGEDDTLAHLSSDPRFIETIIYHQEQAFDGRETISVTEAADLALRDMRAAYEGMSRYLGHQTASEESEMPADEAIVESMPARGENAKPTRRRKPKTVSQKQAIEASEPDNGDFDDGDWLKKWTPRLQNSHSHSE